MKKPAANAITALLDFRVRVSPDAVALVTEHGTLTFAELDAAAEALAGVLRSRGVTAGDLVAVAHDARTGWIGVLAAQKLEAISVGVGSAREVGASGAAWVIAAPRVEWAQGSSRIDPGDVGVGDFGAGGSGLRGAKLAAKGSAPSPADTLESVREPGVSGGAATVGSVPCAVDGWFSPGDRGFLSADTGAGVRLSITGRTADVLNIGGTKVNAAEVDRVARRVSGVIDAAAFAVPSFRGNPALVLALVAPSSRTRYATSLGARAPTSC